MSLGRPDEDEYLERFPRASGDEPGNVFGSEIWDEFSPRERG